jgi:PIN domain nuclease of toxin-antitoxin system
MHQDSRLSPACNDFIEQNRETGLGISAISCWEVAKLVEKGRLELPMGVAQWLELATNEPGIVVVDLSLDIIVDATSLPGSFHADPADQIIAATARVGKVPLVTADRKILAYPHVETKEG